MSNISPISDQKPLVALMRLPRPSYLLRLWAGRRRVSPAALRECEAVLAFYDLGRWRLLRPLLGGRSSHNFLLQTDRGPKVLKKYRWALRSILEEHAILAHLNGTDFPFPWPVLNQDGGTWTEVNGTLYTVYDFIPGFRFDDYYFPGGLRRRFIAQAGETLARFHQLMDGFVPEGQKIDGFMPDGKRLWRDTAWHLEGLGQFVAGISKDSPSPVDGLVLRQQFPLVP